MAARAAIFVSGVGRRAGGPRGVSKGWTGLTAVGPPGPEAPEVASA